MKKSKVIVPAMALLLFSTAASITGTVAWFTSVRTFTTEAGNFEVGQLDGNLACAVTEGVATDVTNNKVSFEANSILGDASYNHTTDHLWTDIAETSNYEDLGTWGDAKWTYGTVNGVKYYYAATWTMTFSYTFVAEQTSMNLFFNIHDAVATITKSGGAEVNSSSSQPAANTAQGFRIAFVGGAAGTATNGVVWAPYRNYSANFSYVSNTSNLADYSSGSTGDILDSSAKTVDALNHAADAIPATTAANYLGTFTKPDSGGVVNLAIRCTAWFDGTDPSIVTGNDTIMQAIKVTMPFYIRKAA